MRKVIPFAISISILLLSVKVYAQTWQQEDSKTFSDMSSISFADNNTGWAFGDSAIGPVFQEGMILKTTDQGVNWNMQNMGSDSIQILSSYAFSSARCIAVGKFQTTGDGAIILTTDGGNTWSRDTTTIPERLFDVDFIGTDDGRVVGRNGYMALTFDAANSWNTQTTGTGEHLFSVSFANLGSGWIVGADPGTGGTILHTINSGTTWTPQTTTTTGDLLAVHAFNDSMAIAVGQSGIMISTIDSGNTWTTGTSGTNQDLNDITFVDDANGWAVGAGGTVIVTTDSGNTWTPETSNTINDIQSIDMRSTSLGWYAGGNGDIYFYGTTPPSGIAQHSEAGEMLLYPNPSSGSFKIKGANGQVEVFDMLGHRILRTNESVIDLSQQPSGIYFIKVGQAVRKLVLR